jgi:PAS domain S-box-containing protein
MTTPLRVLYLEDNPADVELCRHTLRQAGFLVELFHVDTQAEFVAHLSDDLDIILADYSLPQFDAPRALQEVRKRGLDVPFLVISGTIGEDIAVEVIKQGAADYLLKDRLARLGTAVQQALDQRRLRKERLAIEEALRSQDRLFRAVVENAADGIVLLREDLSLAYLSPTAESMSGSGPQDPARQNVLALIHPDDHAAARTVFQQALERPGEVQKVDLRACRKDGTWRWVECAVDNQLDQPDVHAVVVNLRDIEGRKRAEAALRASEEHYRLLFDSNPQPMWVYDIETLAIRAVNFAAVEGYGFSSTEFLKMSILDLRPPEDREAVVESMRTLTGRIRRPGVWTQIRRDGSRLEAEIVTHDLEFEGCPARLVMALDVTERERAHTDLETSERRYRELTEEAPIGIYRTAPDGRILFVNPAFARMLGYDDTVELMTRSLEASPFDASYARADFKRRLEAEGEIRGLEASWTRKDGTHLFIREHARLVRGAGEDDTYYEGTVEDITERRQAEQAVRQLSEFNESIIRNMTEGIVLETMDGTFTLVNPAAASMLGYRVEELTGKHVSSIIPPDQMATVQAAIDRRAQGKSDRYELQLQRKDGTRIAVLVSGSPRIQDGQYVGTIAVFTDITELMAAQAGLARRAHELEALYQTSLEVNAQPDLRSMLQAIVERAVALIGVQAGDIYLLSRDGELLESTAGVGLPEKHPGKKLQRGEGLTGLVFERGETVAIDDYLSWPGRAQVFAEMPFRRSLGVPLRIGGRTIGVLSLADTTRVGDFAPEDIRLIELFADQAAIAVENARLLEAERRRADYLEGVTAASTALRAAGNRAEMLPIIDEQLAKVLRTPHVGIALLVSDQEVEMHSGQGVLARLVGERRSLSEGLVGEILRTGRVFLTTDAGREERILNKELFLGLDCVVGVPMVSQDNRIGAVIVARQSPFEEEEVHMLTAIVEMAGNALNRAGVMETLERRVTERTADLEAANARLQELDQLKSAFVSNVSHELRAPITNILLYLDLLAEPRREDRRPTYMGILRGEANRLHRLIEDLLTLSRLERGAAALDLEPQVLDALIAPVAASQAARAHLKQIDLRHEPNPNVPLVSVALGPMVQVFTNLIGNAVNYAPAGAVVTVSTRIDEARGGRYAAIRVHNTQPAIPEEDLPHLFERFYRGRAALESGEAGTGLGLAICREIVERHNGWIDVESSSDAGTAFTVWLALT